MEPEDGNVSQFPRHTVYCIKEVAYSLYPFVYYNSYMVKVKP
jgi:hypothetical protein